MYSYINFTIEIRPGDEVKHGHLVKVECVDPDGGRVPTVATPTTFSIRRLIPARTAEERVHLGDALGRCMFPPRILAVFHQTLAALKEDTGVRIRLLCLDDEMARWPWELARVEIPSRPRSRYLFRDERFSLVRVVVSDQKVVQPRERRKLVILTVDATKVLHESELVPDFPVELPERAPQGSKGLVPVERYNLTRPTHSSIDERIDRIVGGPDLLDIFHFTGHGRPPREGEPGMLVIHRDDDEAAAYYWADELAKQLAKAGTSLAFVNACYTDDQAAASGAPGIAQSLTGIVPVVVAMRGAVRDRDAKDFAEAFYGCLLRGSTVDEAVARGRVALDESLEGWNRIVVYSRASAGRFLEPLPRADKSVPEESRPQTAPDGIRRWAMAAGARGRWQLVPGEAGPELRRARLGDGDDISHLQTVSASLALSCDARVVAQLNRGRLSLAWVDRVRPRLDRWPQQFALPLFGQQARLLAVAVDYGDEVTCLVSTDRATYRITVSPHAEPFTAEVLEAPTRCAVIMSGSTFTVDRDGQLRGREVDLRTRGIATVTSLDAARSEGRMLWAIAGRDHDGRPIVARGGSPGTFWPQPVVGADEVVVIRPLSRTDVPDQALVTAGGRVQIVPAEGGA